MKVIINGVTFEDPTHLRIEVDPAGETVAPWKIEVVGGPLTVRSVAPEPALRVDYGGLDGFTCDDKIADLTFETTELPALTFMSAEPEPTSWRSRDPLL